MNQPGLFDEFVAPSPKVLARNSDPVTSKLAAAAITEHLCRLYAWAIECIRESPGLTQRELGVKYCPDDLRKIGRRLGELEKMQPPKLRRGEKRPCRVSGRPAETWYVVETK